MGYSPQDRKESDTTEPLHFTSLHFTSLTKVHLVKAMVCPIVMYGCESWTVKKAEYRRIALLNCGVGEDS